MVIELVIRTEDSEDVWTLSSSVALTRRKPPFGNPASVEECCQPYLFSTKLNWQGAEKKALRVVFRKI